MISLENHMVTEIDSIDLDINHIVNSFSSNNINYINLGRRSYLSCWKLQKELHELIKRNDIPSTVLFLEHENVYTLGKNADKNYLLNTYPEIDVVETDRGGQITYHGPGQLVGYPIINLNNYQKSITWFIESIEQIIINTFKDFKIKNDVLAYQNILGGVNAFVNGDKYELTNQLDSQFEIYGDRVLVKMFNNSFMVLENGKKYTN